MFLTAIVALVGEPGAILVAGVFTGCHQRLGASWTRNVFVASLLL